jgi:predicted RNA-binding protein with RPS1 domain
MSIDKNIEKFIKETTVDLQPDLPIPPFKEKDIVEIEISRIVPSSGALAEILIDEDYSGYKGYLHIGKINGSYISDIYDVLYVGQRLKAEVLSLTQENRKWNVQLSTISYFKENQPEEELLLTDKDKKALNQLISQIAQPSDECNQVLTDLIKKHGTVSVTIEMMKTIQDFNPDLSLIFIKEVEKKLSGCL